MAQVSVAGPKVSYAGRMHGSGSRVQGEGMGFRLWACRCTGLCSAVSEERHPEAPIQETATEARAQNRRLTSQAPGFRIQGLGYRLQLYDSTFHFSL